ncbi:MAG: hypothetical protein ACRD63_07045, partial [Pyrinomonadaceae bacterium]
TISLLAVPFDEKRSVNPGRILTKKLCSVIAETLSVFIKGHIARYDDTFNPRAFGDLMTKWGSPVVLIETGGLRGRNEEYLVQLNFIAYIAALNALATDSIRLASTDFYDRLPYNNEGAFFDLLIRNATIVDRSQTVANNQPMRLYVADIGINKNFMPARASTSKSRSMTTINNVGDLAFVYGLDEVDARGWYVTIADGADGANRIGGANDRLRPGADAILLFYRKDRGEQIDWSVPGLESRYPPDALYRQGAWVGREKLNSIK